MNCTFATMNFITQHITDILSQYDGSVPLAIFLKGYYKQFPKMGSRDRKAVSEGIYIYYRSALFLDPSLDPLAVIRQGYFLCDSKNSFLAFKLDIDTTSQPEGIDAYAPHLGVPLSALVPEEAWLKSHWQQPNVFLRIIQNEGLVFELLDQNNITYQKETFTQAYATSYTCISVPNSAPIDKILFPEDYVVQDRSSQLALLIASKYWQANNAKTFWDVCSGAGGKTLLLKHLQSDYRILASDIRSSILYNLKGRCFNYGFKDIKTKEIDATDVTQMAQQLGKQQFDVVLCDVPCSGSGTWSRTPEQFYFFNAAYFDQFAHLQYPIAANSIPFVKKRGLLVYITCSVMEHENEAVVEKLKQHSELTFKHQQMILGMEHHADTLFVAIFEKN